VNHAQDARATSNGPGYYRRAGNSYEKLSEGRSANLVFEFKLSHKEHHSMGKGDQRSRRGKIHRGTYGARRPKPHKGASKPVATAAEIAPKKATRKETAPAAATE
jgi:ribosomal small subunit protein bTHX